MRICIAVFVFGLRGVYQADFAECIEIGVECPVDKSLFAKWMPVVTSVLCIENTDFTCFWYCGLCCSLKVLYKISTHYLVL